MELTLSNSGEDAYWVKLSLGFPWGLSFRKVEMLKVSGKVEPVCPCSSCPAPPHTRQPGVGSRGMQRSLGHPQVVWPEIQGSPSLSLRSHNQEMGLGAPSGSEGVP